MNMGAEGEGEKRGLQDGQNGHREVGERSLCW